MTTVLRQFFIIVLMIAAGCGSSQRHEGLEDYHALARQRFGTEFTTELNKSGSLALCIHEPKSAQLSPRMKVRFLVFDLTLQRALLDDSLDNGKIRWLNDTQLQIDLLPEVIDGSETPDQLGYIYDVPSRRKLNK